MRTPLHRLLELCRGQCIYIGFSSEECISLKMHKQVELFILLHFEKAICLKVYVSARGYIALDAARVFGVMHLNVLGQLVLVGLMCLLRLHIRAL